MESSCQQFGIDILKVISLKDSDKNVIYSPMSIYFALGMTLCGARGDTLSEMIRTLHWNTHDSELYHNEISKLMIEFNHGNAETGLIKIANRLFLEHSFKLLDSFTKVVKNSYGGGVDLLDFKTQHEKSRLAINSWVEEQTNNKIKDLLSSGTIHNSTKLILVNAIYFKGAWQDAFDKCGKQDFHLLNNKTKSVEMINKTKSYQYLDNKTLGFRAVQIPFKRIGNNNYSMMIVLPNDKCTLPKLEKMIFEKEWHSLFGHELFESKSVHITMPKFRIESSFKLKDVLMSLGMVHPFSDTADFSAMTGCKDLMIDNVVHKAFIDVDENGVEAAAATAVMMMKKCCAMRPMADPIEFVCDHPFMFALLLGDNLSLFLGHLVDL